MKVNYESAVDWRQKTDYLRCNPEFYGHPRYDCVIVHTGGDHYIFARLIFVFRCTIDQKQLSLALVHPFDAPVESLAQRPKDKDLRLFRVRAQLRTKPEFIPVHSIVRGALLAPDFDKEGDFFVMDSVDTDMFLRVKRLGL